MGGINKIKIIGTASILVVLMITAITCYAAQSTSVSQLDNVDPGKAETAIGDLVADALRAAMHTDIAFVAASDLKQLAAPIPADAINSSDIIALIAYPDDSLATLTLDGKSIKQALERSVSNYPQSNFGFLQVSGIRFTIDPARPTGSRVSSINIGKSPINDDQKYTAAVSNSLANGALGYWKIWTKDNITSRSQNITNAGALDAYFQANPKLDYSTLNRIITTK